MIINPTTSVTTVTSTATFTQSAISRRHNTRSSAGNSKVVSSYMKLRVSPTSSTSPDETPAESKASPTAFTYLPPYNCTNGTDEDLTPTPSPRSQTDATLQAMMSPAVPIINTITVESLYKDMCDRDAKIDSLINQNGMLLDRINNLENSMDFVKSMLHVKDCVIDGIKGELLRLQQYTRRYSVSIDGIPKQRVEKAGDLRAQVEEIVKLTNSEATVEDIDKLHRNGPVRDGEQSTIVRFKSHSAKEAFYKARKKLPASHRHLKIRPSLAPDQKTLLYNAQQYLEEFDFCPGDGDNPPEFVFANMHGQIQVKMKKPTKAGLFVTIKSVEHLAQVIVRAQEEDDLTKYHHEKEGWADTTPKKKANDVKAAAVKALLKKVGAAGPSKDGNSDDDDDLGFSLFK